MKRPHAFHASNSSSEVLASELWIRDISAESDVEEHL